MVSDKHFILWTSGWDSTFRLIKLVQKDVYIQPIYIIDEDRKSLNIEIKRMNKIKTMVFERYPKSKSKIYPTLFIAKDDIEYNEEAMQSYKKLREKTFFGSQAQWISQLSKQYNNLEHCVHKDDNIESLIRDYVSIYEDSNGDKYYKVDKQKSSEELYDLLGNLKYPILDYTKLEIKDIAVKEGFIDIMNETWFCHSPISSEPCGVCNPCKYVIEEGMSYRLSNKAIIRNKIGKPYKYYRKIKEKLIK